ncbi:MAG: DUF433 domain-containing protein [Planctomycetes bacterium]|nr:DUF433 domain-containing protein [Planctomycetota bacterium]
MTDTTTKHIVLDEQGRAFIEGTRFKVKMIAMEKIAHGWSAEEIARQHDGYLSMAQIYAALSYYHDHQAEFDAEFERELEEYEKLRAANLDSPLRQKLRRLGKIR